MTARHWEPDGALNVVVRDPPGVETEDWTAVLLRGDVVIADHYVSGRQPADSARFWGLARGDYVLEATASVRGDDVDGVDGVVRARSRVTLAPGEARDVTLTFDPFGVVEVLWPAAPDRDSERDVPAALHYTALPLDASGEPSSTRALRDFIANVEHGVARFGLPVGRYVVLLSPEDPWVAGTAVAGIPVAVTVSAAGTVTRVEPEPSHAGTLSIRLVDDPRQARILRPVLSLRGRTREGVPLVVSDFWGYEGRLEVRSLPAGTYELEIKETGVDGPLIVHSLHFDGRDAELSLPR